MEPCSSSLPSALISFLSMEEIQSIIHYEKNDHLPACSVCCLVDREGKMRTGFVHYQIFYEEK